jgi:hypothetical protein
VIYSYNKSQQNALLLTFILVKNSTCFGQIYCPSSGVLILYLQQLVVGSYYQFLYDGAGWLKGNQTDLLNERTSNSAIYLEIGFY